jgi:hypothetical protein
MKPPLAPGNRVFSTVANTTKYGDILQLLTAGVSFRQAFVNVFSGYSHGSSNCANGHGLCLSSGAIQNQVAFILVTFILMKNGEWKIFMKHFLLFIRGIKLATHVFIITTLDT